MLIKRQRAYELMMKEMSVSRRERNDSIAEEREPAETNYPNVRNSLQKSIKKNPNSFPLNVSAFLVWTARLAQMIV